MSQDLDEHFYDRADAHIDISNNQLKEIARGRVSASMMYATARFNSWVSACGFNSGVEMAEKKAETITYFVDQYKAMLEENLDEYIENFEEYIFASRKPSD